ncbi:hypothetical protein G7046_g2602 [Stylonectria norvegica]|nr:hypothetical protein G7046_g2602 [Stylonectria norvegica]
MPSPSGPMNPLQPVEEDLQANRPSRDQPIARHVCHCGKDFLRKEHLRRHQATHGERSFVCRVCQRSFTRNDLLRRHLSRHDATATPDGRRGRACDACHSNKTKCDGGTQCSLCVKRNISCTYNFAHTNRDNVVTAPAALDAPAVPVLESLELLALNVAPIAETGEGDASLVAGLEARSERSLEDRTPSVEILRIVDNLVSGAVPLAEHCELNEAQQAKFEETMESYFRRFHDCWPIIHAPTFLVDGHSVVLIVSVFMIGVWLENNDDTTESCLKIHISLMDLFFKELSHPEKPSSDQQWPVHTYQAMVLNIIFAFYQGSEQLISRAVVLRGMLIATLRELDFFLGENALHQQRTYFPGTFLPYVLSHREQWKRLITCLYKIDTYLAIAREQAPSLLREELDVTLTSTFGLWNSFGLDVFFKRVSFELADRSAYTFAEVIRKPQSSATPLLLVEDIQVALCGLLPEIWHHAQICRRGNQATPSAQELSESIVWQLGAWKAELERISKASSECFLEDRTEDFPYVTYLGREVHDTDDWKKATMVRIEGLVSDALMLYHVQSIRIYTDTRAVKLVAKYLESPPEGKAVPPKIQKHQARLHGWASTVESRKALLHAIAVLKAMEREASQNSLPDPIGYVAVSMSALVVWAWITYAEAACACVPNVNHVNIGVEPPGLQCNGRMEDWVRIGGSITLDGIALCRCATAGWMARFDAALPQGTRKWELGRGIAPILRPLGQPL